ncbi:MAG: LCP family protein [Dermatophilaceae bacterium]
MRLPGAPRISTVQQFLGIGIDHFVEVTMAAFYEVARVVQPITVCLKRDTKDSHSGADFKAGEQQLSAEQALAFVRQRQDPAHPDMTDLDRSRRQQAFIVSLLSQLRQAQTFSNPARLKDLLEVGTRNTVVDSRLDLLSFAGQARDMAGGNLTFYTLPIEGFGKSRSGEDVNLVDATKIRATVAALFAPAGSPATTGPSATSSATSSPPGAGVSTSPTSPRSTTRPGPTSPAVPTPIDATGGGKTGPAVTELSELTSGGIPCVR